MRKAYTIVRWTSMAAAGLLLLGWLAIAKPWQREVWIETTSEAFLGPSPGAIPIQVVDGQIRLTIGLTPAPWPDQAQQIWDALGRGKVVHVTLRSKGQVIRFDINGRTSQGEVFIMCQSVAQANRLAETFGLRQ